MKNVKVVVKTELFDGIGVKVGQLNCYINEKNDFNLFGSVSTEEGMEGRVLRVKANLCDEENRVWYVLDDFSGISFETVKYDTFSISCAALTRFFDITKLHHVEVYPKIVKKKDVE